MSSRYPRHLLAATAAGFFASSFWNVTFDSARTSFLADLGINPATPEWLMVLEPVRTVAVAVALGAAIRRMTTTTRRDTLKLAAAVFAAFPAVLLIGSVIHGESSFGLAAIHAGDWALKLAVIALIMRRYHLPTASAGTELIGDARPQPVLTGTR